MKEIKKKVPAYVAVELKKIGDKLRAVRGKAKLSQKDVAEAVGFKDAVSISNIENGASTTTTQFIKLCHELGLEITIGSRMKVSNGTTHATMHKYLLVGDEGFKMDIVADEDGIEMVIPNPQSPLPFRNVRLSSEKAKSFAVAMQKLLKHHEMKKEILEDVIAPLRKVYPQYTDIELKRIHDFSLSFKK